QPRTLPEIHTLLEGLEGQAFLLQVAALLETQPAPTLLAVVLRAGSDDVPGLSGARAERRAARRAEALDWLAADEGRRWFGPLRAVLAQPEEDVELLHAALRTAARLARHDLAIDLRWNLGQQRSASVRDVARGALHDLYGRWFPDRAAFDEVWDRLQGHGADDLFLDELGRLEARADDLERMLLELQPERAAQVFQSPSPDLRARAAQVVGRGVGLQSIKPVAAIALLIERVKLETDPRAFDVTLGELLGLLGGLGSEAEAVAQLRQALASPDVRGRRSLIPSVVDALARMPWSKEPGDHDETVGVAQVAELVGELASTQRAVDYDGLSLALGAFRSLCARTSLSPDQVTRASASTRVQVLDLLTRPEVPLESRLDAAGVVSYVADRGELWSLLAVVEETGSARLQLVLLSSIEALTAGGLGEEGSGAPRFLALLSRLLGSPDVDLRRRASQMLQSEALSPIIALHGPRVGLGPALLDALGSEGVSDLQGTLLTLLRTHPPAIEVAAELLELANFDEFSDGASTRLADLAATLATLYARDPELTLAAAQRVAADRRDPIPQDSADPALRCGEALRLVSALGQAAATAMSAEGHAAVLSWGLCVRHAGGDPAGGPDELKPLLQRLVRVHLPGASDPAHAGARAYERALFGGDLHLTDAESVQRAVVLADYEQALAAARAAEPGAVAPERLLRDRARFLDAAGDPPGAREDYRTLLFPDGRAGPRLPGALLSVADLRRAAELLAAEAGAAAAARAARVGLLLVGHPDWAGAPRGERETDLETLTARARASGVEDVLEALLDLYRDLPLIYPDEHYTRGENGVYAGKVYDRLLYSAAAHGVQLQRVEDVEETLRGVRDRNPAPGGDSRR
ncbi:MAG: hypothetical protein V3T22_09435, partial [Planctomycetota bacterium]